MPTADHDDHTRLEGLGYAEEPLPSSLRRRFAAAADAEGILDIAYRTIDSPLGPLLLAATDRGLLRVVFESEGHAAVLDTLAARISPRILHGPARLDAAARELDQYFAGHRAAFGLDIDWQLSRGFRREVLAHLSRISYGTTASYRTVADAVGRPRAVRAVGSACGSNPVPVVVPCHRVVRADGSLGGYAGGLDRKRTLLALERAGREGGEGPITPGR